MISAAIGGGDWKSQARNSTACGTPMDRPCNAVKPVIIIRGAGWPGARQVLPVRLQRGDAALDRLPGDVDAVGRPRVAADEQPPRRPRLQALVQQFGEHPPIAGVAQRIHRGQTRHPVIGLVQPGHELDVPGPHHHRLGPEPSDDRAMSRRMARPYSSTPSRYSRNSTS